MRLHVCHLQARKRKLGIYHVKTRCKSRLVGQGLAAVRFFGKFTGFLQAFQAALGMFHFAPALFHQQTNVIHGLLFHARKRPVKRLRVTHLGASLAALEQIPLKLCSHGPFGFQDCKVARVKFLVCKKCYRRVIIGAGRTHGILAALAFGAQLSQSRVSVHGELLEFFHAESLFRGHHRRNRGNVRVGMQQACESESRKRLIAVRVFESVLRFGQGDFGTQAFRLADLTTFFKLLGASQVFFQVFLGAFA